MLIDDGEVKPFSFTIEDSTGFPPSLSSHQAKETLIKWNLDKCLSCYRLKFKERFRPAFDAEAFLKDLLCDKSVKNIFGVVADPVKVSYKKLSTNVLSMEFFDRLEQEGIVVPESGYIKKCLDEDFQGVLVSDKLREMLVNEDSENTYIYSDEEKAEFVYQLFRIISIGGGMCQAEDTITPLLDATKGLYKDLCTVQKNSKTNKLEITSQVYKIMSVTTTSSTTTGTSSAYNLYSRESDYNACIVVVDANKKTCTLLINDWKPFW